MIMIDINLSLLLTFKKKPEILYGPRQNHVHVIFSNTSLSFIIFLNK